MEDQAPRRDYLGVRLYFTLGKLLCARLMFLRCSARSLGTYGGTGCSQVGQNSPSKKLPRGRWHHGRTLNPPIGPRTLLPFFDRAIVAQEPK